MRVLACASALGATVAAAQPASAPCADAASWQLAAGEQRVALKALPAKPVVGRHFQLDIQLCSAAAGVRGLRVDADMPAHRHGMNYRTSVKRVADDRWRAEGLMLHMGGRWRFIVELDMAGGPQRLTHELDVE